MRLINFFLSRCCNGDTHLRKNYVKYAALFTSVAGAYNLLFPEEKLSVIYRVWIYLRVYEPLRVHVLMKKKRCALKFSEKNVFSGNWRRGISDLGVGTQGSNVHYRYRTPETRCMRACCKVHNMNTLIVTYISFCPSGSTAWISTKCNTDKKGLNFPICLINSSPRH